MDNYDKEVARQIKQSNADAIEIINKALSRYGNPGDPKLPEVRPVNGDCANGVYLVGGKYGVVDAVIGDLHVKSWQHCRFDNPPYTIIYPPFKD